MYLFLKDHKVVEDGNLPKTRPLVSGCSGLGVSLSNMMSDALEAVADMRKDPFAVVSGEDFLSRVNECNEMLRRERQERGEREDACDDEEDEIVIIGSDVSALFPSLESKLVGKVIREVMEQSK